MNDLRKTILKVLPDSVQDIARKSYYAMLRASQLPEASLHPWRIKSKHFLEDFHNQYNRERCFVIGNGPSLRNTDLSKLANEFTFGMNRIYLLFPELGFPTTFYLSVNDLVIEQCVTDILPLPIPKFLSWRSHKVIQSALPNSDMLPESPPLAFLHTTYTGPKFAKNAKERLWEGATITYVALQLAYHMGFQTVVLIGVDHSFQAKGKPNTTVTSEGDDADHFASNYFGKGFRWQLPDLDTSEKAYRLARKVYEADGRKILDATIGGKLTVFPKATYDTLF